MRTMVWFRSDLRTRDNTALLAAARAAGGAQGHGVIGLFVLSPDEWRRHEYSPARVDLILRTLKELSARLDSLNIPLRVETARQASDVPGVVAAVARDHGCEVVHFNIEYEVNEQARDAATIAQLEREGLAGIGHHDQCMHAPGTIRTGDGRPYTVFTPFKKAVLAARSLGGRAPAGAPPRQAETNVTRSPVPTKLEGFECTVPASLWPAGEDAALRQLESFCAEKVTAYKDMRDFPAAPGTSRLSAAFTVGALSHRQAVYAAEACAPQGEGVTHWISEVIWREFYIHVLAAFPRVCKHRAFRLETERLTWNNDESQFRAWCDGRTGIPIVDAGMRQLQRDGWMHNRIRMVTAMFLTKNLFIDWRRGESHFMRHLVDGFLASNNGGWQWSAGTGTDAAPYFRIFNPVSQSRKFDPEGTYIREYVPELRGLSNDAIHEPWELPPLARMSMDYPERPIVDLKTSREAAIEAFRRLSQ